MRTRPQSFSLGSFSYLSFLIHRISGLALAVFLPLHFLVLSSALQGEARFESVLGWTEHPLVKTAEWGLVVLLSAHLLGGIRLILIEFGSWRGARGHWIVLAALGSLAVGALFIVMQKS